LSRSDNIGEPRGGTSSANGCGKGWQLATNKTVTAARLRANRRRIALITVAGRRSSLGPGNGTRRHETNGPRAADEAMRLFAEHDHGEAAPVSPFTAQAGASIAEKAPLLGDRVMRSTRDDRNPGPSEPVLDVARQIEHEMAGAQRGSEV